MFQAFWIDKLKYTVNIQKRWACVERNFRNFKIDQLYLLGSLSQDIQLRKPHITDPIFAKIFFRSCLRLVPLTRLLSSERRVLVVYLRPGSDLSASNLESDG